MEPKLKRGILDQIQLNELLNNILLNKKIDEQILKKISEIINLIGLFIIENFNYTQELIKTSNNKKLSSFKKFFKKRHFSSIFN